jgi:hypothetical protein
MAENKMHFINFEHIDSLSQKNWAVLHSAPLNENNPAYLTLIFNIKITVTSFLYAKHCHVIIGIHTKHEGLKTKKFCPIKKRHTTDNNFYFTITIEVKVNTTHTKMVGTGQHTTDKK